MFPFKQLRKGSFLLKVQLNLKEDSVWIIITSSTGDGDPPDNALLFWKFIRKTKDSLSNVHFSILGLGDSNYDQFCNTANRIEKKLVALGATSFYQKGLADVVDVRS